MSSTWQILAVVATLAMALATFVLAIVAVFQSKIVEWLHKPKLTMRLAPREEYPYASLYVSNEEGWGPAHDVELVALSLVRTDRPWEGWDLPLPANFRWGSQTSHDRSLPVLCQGMFWRSTVLVPTLVATGGRGVEGSPYRVFDCCLRVALGKQTGIELPPGEYVLQVRLVARNHKPVDAELRITWTEGVFRSRREAAIEGCKLELL